MARHQSYIKKRQRAKNSEQKNAKSALNFMQAAASINLKHVQPCTLSKIRLKAKLRTDEKLNPIMPSKK
jgi:hypothetical protein